MRTRSLDSILLLAFVSLLAACATTPPPTALPQGYDGPTATISDTTAGGGRNQAGTFFTLAQVDGGAPLRTSLDRTRAASFGQGFTLRVVGQKWVVKAAPVELKLVGRIAYAAPIQEMFAGSRLRRIEGTVEVTLQPGGQYVVNGYLDPYRTEIWLEDETTHEILSKKILTPPNPDLLAQTTASGQFICCNLRYDDDSIHDANLLSEPFVPLGARAKVVAWGRAKAHVLVDGRAMIMELNAGEKILTREQLVNRYVVDTDPSLRLAAFSPDVQRLIRAGKVATGMTREQVLMAIGYPRPDSVPDLAASRWKYLALDEVPFSVVWDAEGRVQSVEGSPAARLVAAP